MNSRLEGVSPRLCTAFSLVTVFLLGGLDYLLGPELSFSVFYTAPIMLAGWYGGRKAGSILVILSALVWIGTDLAAGARYSSQFVPFWNMLVRLAFFSIILGLLLVVRDKLALEESLADTDPLTGLANRRFFQEQLEREYSRVHRYPEPFTIAYFDLDHFKSVNDTMGHDTGDELLQSVGRALASNVRETDFAARLGGDEFAVLFPLLEKEKAASVLEKIQRGLLSAMKEKRWPVTFSIGAVTFDRVMESSREMVRMVDELMYEVKRSGKNNIRHLVWPS